MGPQGGGSQVQEGRGLELGWLHAAGAAYQAGHQVPARPPLREERKRVRAAYFFLLT